MRKYLYQARAGGGEPVSGYIEAESSLGARDSLAARGLSEIAVIDDDLSAEVRAIAEREGVEPDVEIDFLTRYEPTSWGLALVAVRRNLVWIVLGLALAAWLAVVGWYLFAALALAGIAALPAFPAWVQWQQNEMHREFWRGRYDASERIARRLRDMRFHAHAPSIRAELDARIAGSMAKRGDLAGALAMVAAWEGSEHVPAATHLNRVAHLHFLSRDWSRYLELMERIERESAGADFARIDLAQVLARMGDDDLRAAELLDGLDPGGLGPMHQAFIGWARGVLALRAGRNEAALDELSRAVAAIQTMAANPVTWGAVALATGYLCVAMARQGMADRARAMLATVRPIVEAHAEDRLLDWLRAEGLLS